MATLKEKALQLKNDIEQLSAEAEYLNELREELAISTARHKPYKNIMTGKVEYPPVSRLSRVLYKALKRELEYHEAKSEEISSRFEALKEEYKAEKAKEHLKKQSEEAPEDSVLGMLSDFLSGLEVDSVEETEDGIIIYTLK
nr:MAG TPA: hypothetical protein [Caudoviricetes sp.]